MRNVVRMCLRRGHHRELPQVRSLFPKRALRSEKMASPHLLLQHRILKLIDGVSRAWKWYFIRAYSQKGKGKLCSRFMKNPNWLILDWAMSQGLRTLWHDMGTDGWFLNLIIILQSWCRNFMQPMQLPYFRIFPRGRSLLSSLNYKRC